MPNRLLPSVLLVSSLAASLTACGGTSTPSRSPDPVVDVSIIVPPGTFSGRGSISVSIENASGAARGALETFTFAAASLASPVRIAARTLRPGEPYRVSIGGLASDDCNQTGASAEGVLQGTTLTIERLSFATTTMACDRPPLARSATP